MLIVGTEVVGEGGTPQRGAKNGSLATAEREESRAHMMVYLERERGASLRQAAECARVQRPWRHM